MNQNPTAPSAGRQKQITSGRHTSTSTHGVQFYSHTNDFYVALYNFLAEGLRRGEPCIVVCTAQHLAAITGRLQGEFDIQELERSGILQLADARTLLDSFMSNGYLLAERFEALVGRLLANVPQPAPRTRIYGEMVALLWQEGNKEAVFELERLWNDCIAHHPIDLLCSYPEIQFFLDMDVNKQIKQQHSYTLPSTVR